MHEGIKICTGDHILFHDSDLELDTKDSFEMYQIIKKDKTIKCVFGNRYLTGKLKSNKNYFNEFVGRINSLIFNILIFPILKRCTLWGKNNIKRSNEKNQFNN